jgi:arylsulfatase A-like enzyme
MRIREVFAGTALTAGCALLAIAAQATPAEAQGGDAGGERPNVVVVMSDDQTQESMRFMPKTQGLIGAQGATFPTNVTNWPVCCPSRATFLTGQYAHNHLVLGNTPPAGGFDRLNQAQTLPVWLQAAGYYTAHIGKFLNGYESSSTGVPLGWSEWHGSKRTYTFYGYQLLEDGQLNTYGSTSTDPDAPADPSRYSTDVYTDKAVELIGRRAPEDQPFFLSVAYLAPHSGGPNPDPPNESRCNATAKPAPRHIGALDAEPLPLPPNFNEADVSDKPAGLAGRAPLTEQQIQNATRNYRCRGESLLAIDEGVERIVEALTAAGELDNTLFVYTSDNGFFHGEHRIQNGKNRVYEEAIRVPLMIRGPGIKAGAVVDEITVNADLAPTILEAANAQAGVAVDGTSLLPFAEDPRRLHGRELLIEQDASDDDGDGSANGVFYDAIRNARYTYVENASGERELYDLDADPFQLDNQIANPAYDAAEAALAARLASLRVCAGASCRTKPLLKLKLPRSIREDGRSCRPIASRGFIVKLRGAGTRSLSGASFTVGGQPSGIDRAGPWKDRVRPRLLRAKRRPEIRVDSELVDGRSFSLEKRIRICG